MKPTIYDIARLAKVSTATVSKVINNNGKISINTRQRVLKIIEELHYQPNVLASAMKGKLTYQIALLIPDMDNPIYAQYLKSIEASGQGFGFSIVLCSTDNDPEKEAKHITLMRQKQVDGFIIASRFKNTRMLEELLKDEVPVVLFAYEKPELLIDSVTVDDYQGGIIATEHLLALGHRRIGVIAEETFSSNERVRGYLTALQNAGIDPVESLIMYSGHKIDEAEATGGRLLDLAERPSAIFGCNDILAVGSMRAARIRGIAIPEELSVVGFDNTVWCKIIHPELTSVAMPVGDLGQKVMEVIVNKIERGQKINQRIRMFPEIKVRATTSNKQ
ncbi:HTH-type transcriptional regulator DegA [compost metagenome]